MKEVGQEANSSFQNLQAGELIRISLPEGAATPYLWEIENASNSDLISINEDFEPSKFSAIGATGKKIFIIEALKKGTVKLQIKYWDKWGNHTLERFELTLIIH